MEIAGHFGHTEMVRYLDSEMGALTARSSKHAQRLKLKALKEHERVRRRLDRLGASDWCVFI